MPYWRLSSLYFFYFAVVGVMSPYWGLYLQNLGFASHQIGVLAAAPLLTKLIAPNIWGWFADRTGKRILTIRLGALGACIFFTGLIFYNDYLAILILLGVYSIFWNAILPQFEATTLTFLRDKPFNYSNIRVWGSLGFIVTVLLLGWLFEYTDISLLPSIVLIFLIFILLFSCSLPALPASIKASENVEFIGLLKRKGVFVFFLVLFFLQFSHGVYYVFYSIYLESHGYSKSLVGVMWAVGVVSEIVIFVKMPKMLNTFTRFHLLCVALLATAIRWILIGGYVSHLYILIFAQLLHALSFGVIHAVAIDFIKFTFGESAQGQGQAFYSAVSFGGGASLGAFVSGWLWDLSQSLTFSLAAFAAFVSWILTIVFLKTRL